MRSFELPQNDDGTEEKGLSRREFLKKGALFAGSALLSWRSPFLGEGAFSKEVREGDTFVEGVLHLKEDVYQNNVETIALFVRGENDNGRWPYQEDGSVTRAVEAIWEHLDTHIQETPQKLTIVHTHPIEAIRYVNQDVLNQENAAKMKVGALASPSAPPSIQDIEFAAIVTDRYREKRTKIRNGVVDPIGLWTYETDSSHPFSGAVSRRTEAIRTHLFTLQKSESIKGFLIEKRKPGASLPTTFEGMAAFLYNERRQFADIESDALTAIHEALQTYAEYMPAKERLNTTVKTYVRESIARSLGSTTEHMITLDDLQAEYAQVGANVSFETFKDIRGAE